MTSDLRRPTPHPEQGSAPFMVFVDPVKTGLQRFADFSGRASRREFCGFFLFYFLGIQGFAKLEALHSGIIALTALFALIFLLPMLVVLVRRHHDTNRSGVWALLCLIPIIGPLVLIFFAAQKSA